MIFHKFGSIILTFSSFFNIFVIFRRWTWKKWCNFSTKPSSYVLVKPFVSNQPKLISRSQVDSQILRKEGCAIEKVNCCIRFKGQTPPPHSYHHPAHLSNTQFTLAEVASESFAAHKGHITGIISPSYVNQVTRARIFKPLEYSCRMSLLIMWLLQCTYKNNAIFSTIPRIIPAQFINSITSRTATIRLTTRRCPYGKRGNRKKFHSGSRTPTI